MKEMKKKLIKFNESTKERLNVESSYWLNMGGGAEHLALKCSHGKLEINLLIESSKEHNWIILLMIGDTNLVAEQKESTIKFVESVLVKELYPLTITTETDLVNSISSDVEDKVIIFDDLKYPYEEVFIFSFGGHRKSLKISLERRFKEKGNC